RRHTRFSRDWSSDVCSSDLGRRPLPETAGSVRQAPAVSGRGRRPGTIGASPSPAYAPAAMTRPVLLNNVDHGHLKVLTRRAAGPGDTAHHVLTFPTEFADVQREYPILFRRHADTGEYQAVALVGLAEGENLFLDGD